jgi:POT family proton-dependent oligopeptide transporter
LAKRHRELGSKPAEGPQETAITFERTAFSGGQTRLQGAAYFWFFMGLMLVTAVVYVPFAMIYRPRSYLQ